MDNTRPVSSKSWFNLCPRIFSSNTLEISGAPPALLIDDVEKFFLLKAVAIGAKYPFLRSIA